MNPLVAQHHCEGLQLLLKCSEEALSLRALCWRCCCPCCRGCSNTVGCQFALSAQLRVQVYALPVSVQVQHQLVPAALQRLWLLQLFVQLSFLLLLLLMIDLLLTQSGDAKQAGIR